MNMINEIKTENKKGDLINYSKTLSRAVILV